MFGLMTVARHEREMGAMRARMDDMKASLVIERASLQMMIDESAKWHTLATKLAADLADLQRRYAPMPIPDDLAPGEGSVGDGDAEWTPTALAAKAKAVR
jgi:hypothetical protein